MPMRVGAFRAKALGKGDLSEVEVEVKDAERIGELARAGLEAPPDLELHEGKRMEIREDAAPDAVVFGIVELLDHVADDDPRDTGEGRRVFVDPGARVEARRRRGEEGLVRRL